MTYAAVELEAFRRIAFGRCRAAGAGVEDAQDCAQDAIAALLAHPGVTHPKAWVATVAYHRYVDVCRLRQRESVTGLLPPPDTRLPDLAGPEEEVVDRVQARWLVRAMHRWPASTRTVCLEVATGKPRPAVVDRLGITDRAVESHLTRARRQLRALSLLGVAVAVAVALGRLARRVGPMGKPAAAAVIVPSLALTLVIGGSARWPDRAERGESAPDASVSSLVEREPAPPPVSKAVVPSTAEPSAPVTDAAVPLPATSELLDPLLPTVPVPAQLPLPTGVIVVPGLSSLPPLPPAPSVPPVPVPPWPPLR